MRKEDVKTAKNLPTLVHRGCGGTTYEDWADPFRYEYPREDGATEIQPRTRCRRCNVEITGDAMLEFVGPSADLFNEAHDDGE